MVEHSRYSVSEKDAGIQDGLLKNKLNISDQKMLDDAETILLSDAYDHFFGLLEKDIITFNVSFLFSIHEYFLGTLYEWAGSLRTVDISKDDMLFAPVKHLKSSLKSFEKLLVESIPVSTDSKKQISQKLAIIHNEFNALHPFREGNGRTIRLFLDLLSVHCGYQPINWKKKDQKTYLNACKKGMSQEHVEMAKLIYLGLIKR